MSAVLVFAAAAGVTWMLRSWMSVAGARLVESDRFAELTALVTPAVLTAMVVSALVVVHGHVAMPRIGAVAAVLVAYLVARRTGNVGAGLVLGLIVHAGAGFIGLA